MLSTTEFIHPNISSIKSWSSSPSLPTPAAGQISSVEPDRPRLTGGRTCAANDEELTALARNGDNEAFDQLIQRHRDRCMRRALLTMRDRSDAEDAVQNACRRAFQCLEQFEGTGTFAAWLSRIVETQCLLRIREKTKAHFVYLDNPTESNVRLELVGQTTNPEDELGREQVVKVLRQEMLRMPPVFRNIMLLRDSEQLSISDVAVRLGLSVPAAKSRLLRARRELRSRIAKHCGRKGPGTLLEKAVYSRTAYARAS